MNKWINETHTHSHIYIYIHTCIFPININTNINMNIYIYIYIYLFIHLFIYPKAQQNNNQQTDVGQRQTNHQKNYKSTSTNTTVVGAPDHISQRKKYPAKKIAGLPMKTNTTSGNTSNQMRNLRHPKTQRHQRPWIARRNQHFSDTANASHTWARNSVSITATDNVGADSRFCHFAAFPASYAAASSISSSAPPTISTNWWGSAFSVSSSASSPTFSSTTKPCWCATSLMKLRLANSSLEITRSLHARHASAVTTANETSSWSRCGFYGSACNSPRFCNSMVASPTQRITKKPATMKNVIPSQPLWSSPFSWQSSPRPCLPPRPPHQQRIERNGEHQLARDNVWTARSNINPTVVSCGAGAAVVIQ